MNFDKEIRARLAAPYPSAPYVMSGDDGATERGIFSLKKHDQLETFDLTDEQAWPEYITLHASVEGIPLEEEGPQVALTLAGKRLMPRPFYHLETLLQSSQEVGQAAQHQALKISYKGFGHYMKRNKTYLFEGDTLDSFKVTLEKEQEIFRLDFDTQSQGILHQKEFPQGDFWLTVAPNGAAGERLYPLLSYGGYFKTGIDLKRMEPIFALIKQGEEDVTALHLLSASELRQMGVTPPRVRREGGEEWIFCSHAKSPSMMSLAGAIVSGAAKIHLFDSEGIESCLYSSVAYEQTDPAVNHITITFKPLI